jgi:transposase
MSNVKRVNKFYPKNLKEKVVKEYESGVSAGELSRKYEVNYKNIYRWVHLSKTGQTTALKSNEDVVPASEFKRASEKIQKLERALGKMTLERDILKDAVEIASKKKWI